MEEAVFYREHSMEFPSISDSGVQLPIRPLALAFDLDGTLLDYDGHMSDSVARAVRLISRGGIKVFIVTGRLQAGAERYWEELELDTPIAGCNGGYIGLPGQKPIRHIRLSEKARKIILDFDTGQDLFVNYAIDNAIFCLHDSPERDYYSRAYSLVTLASGVEDILERPLPTKCLCITPEADQPHVLEMFRAALAGEAEITTSNNRFIEIMPPGVDKGTAIETLAEWSGFPVEGFIAVGDAMNDLPMLRKAGFAISFKSGDPRMADEVDMLLPPLWEDGMEVLAKCVLGMTGSGRFLTPRSSRFFKK